MVNEGTEEKSREKGNLKRGMGKEIDRYVRDSWGVRSNLSEESGLTRGNGIRNKSLASIHLKSKGRTRLSTRIKKEERRFMGI